jgi:hypothetical protein
VESDEYLGPYLAQYLPIRNLMIVADDMSISRSSFDFDSTQIQRDPVFEGRLLWRIARQQATLRESKVLLDETEKLLALIVAEID